MNNQTVCAECHAPRTSKKRCRVCKSNEYFRRKGIAVDSACKTCGILTRVFANSECKRCLNNKGLKECRACREIKLTHVDFDSKKGVCRDCLHPMAHLPRWLRSRDASLREKYGIGGEEFMALAEKQKHVCFICNRKLKLVVDYDEKQKKVRGLLCHSCSIGVSSFKGSPEAVARAANYLSGSNLQERGLDNNGREMEMLQMRLGKAEGAISRSEE
ncbi:hypothetical protein EBZ39_09880 [bacterium]|nr:hypothetical protein [bacterium]